MIYTYKTMIYPDNKFISARYNMINYRYPSCFLIWAWYDLFYLNLKCVEVDGS